MTGRVPRSVWWTAGIATAIVACVLFFRLPWEHTPEILAGVTAGLLTTALLINLVSPFAKGWAWHLLLKPVAPNRWWVAQEANLIGTAVNSLAAGVAGEAARISLMMRRDAVPFRRAL